MPLFLGGPPWRTELVSPVWPRLLTMKPKAIYLWLCVAGTIVPYWQLLPFLREYGLNLPLMIARLFATPVSAFFGVDVIVSSLVLWVFVAVDGRRNGVPHLWAPILGNLLVGVSLGLPMFLYMRERAGIISGPLRLRG
jgi:Terpene cyclase DEP1